MRPLHWLQLIKLPLLRLGAKNSTLHHEAVKEKNAQKHRYISARGEAKDNELVISGIFYLLPSGVYYFSSLLGAKWAFYFSAGGAMWQFCVREENVVYITQQ